MPQRIVVVNDVQAVLHLFHELLTGEKYEVLLYSYGSENLKEIDAFKPDLIILDYVIGNETPGWTLLERIKMRPISAHIPIIICTAYLKYIQEIEGNLITKGVTLVTKPFEPDELLKAISQMLTPAKKGS